MARVKVRAKVLAMHWRDAATTGESIALVANAALAVLLYCTRRSWSIVPGYSASSDHHRCASTGSPRARLRCSGPMWMATLAAITVLAGWLRWNPARSSLWWDEVWQARNASIGDWRPDRKTPGHWKWEETSWAEALWQYRKPANHPPMSLAQKAAHSLWRTARRAPEGEINEFILRLPGLAASLGSVVLLGLALRQWSFPISGLVAAFLLAVHPWHVRYGIDARGYTFVVVLTLAALIVIARLLRSERIGPDPPGQPPARPRRRDWWLFGLIQAMIVWSHLLSVWVCAGLFGGTAWVLGRAHHGADRRRVLARLVAVHVAAAGLFLQLFLPNLLQALNWGERNRDGNELDAAYLRETLGQLAVGCHNIALRPGLEIWLTAAGFALFLAIGWRRIHDRHLPAATNLTAIVAAGVCLLLLVAAGGMYFYHRFVIALVIPWCLLLGAGLMAPFAAWPLAVRARNWRTVAASSFGAVAVAILIAAAGPPIARENRRLAEVPVSPLRDTADVLRQQLAAGHHVLGLGFGSEALQYYLPELPVERGPESGAALERARQASIAAGRRLFVAVGYEEFNRSQISPGEWDALDDPARFTEIVSFPGLEALFTFRVLATPTSAR